MRGQGRRTVVVGSGPAGASAAIRLAAAGRPVVVLDKATFPRDKCCGDGLTSLALRELEALGLDPRSVESWTWIDSVEVSSPDQKVVRFPLSNRRRCGAVARRRELDDALVRRARAVGAEVREGCQVVDARPGAGAIELTLHTGEAIEADFVIAADGKWSRVARSLRSASGPELGEWHAYRQYLRVDDRDEAAKLWIWFEPELVPGYAWSFPLTGGHVNFGFAVKRGPSLAGADLRVLWSSLLDRPHIAAVLGPGARPAGPVRSWPIPARLDPALLTGGNSRVLFVGDAAGMGDPMTGEGIGQALLSGRLAAAAVLDKSDKGPEAVASRFMRDIVRSFEMDFRASSYFANKLSTVHGANKGVRLAERARGLFGLWLFEDFPRGLPATPRRWAQAVHDVRSGPFALEA